MRRLPPINIALAVLFLLNALAGHSFAGSLGADYLCDLGIAYYDRGDYANAIHEFKKALIVDPYNEEAKDYIAEIQSIISPGKKYASKPSSSGYRKQSSGYETAVEYGRVDYQPSSGNKTQPKYLTQDPGTEDSPRTYKKERKPVIAAQKGATNGLVVSGNIHLSGGIDDGQKAEWRKAHYDLNEENWRILSDSAHNRKENTFDPAIYQRLQVNVDTKNEQGPGFHTTLIVDPWSFPSKSETITLTSSNGDIARLTLKSFANNGYTLNETYYNLNNGLSIGVPEIKMHGDHITGTTITDTWGNTLTIPEITLERQFQPVRELWFRYNQENLKFKIYPFAYENQTVVFNDPLTLSGNRSWWEESPWIRQWRPGVYHSGSSPADFTKGYWDNSLSFGTKDSTGQRLTQLRGATLEMGNKDETLLVTSVASSKDPWQDYSDYDNALAATRITRRAGDNVIVGASTTQRLGFNPEMNNKTDARNIVGAVDATAEITPGIMAGAEIAVSKSDYDLTSGGYRTEKRGSAYYASLIGRNDAISLIDTPGGYSGIRPEKGENIFTKWRLIAAHMDEGFDPSLSSYRETRDDEYWARHIHFRDPYKFYTFGVDLADNQTYDDVLPFAIGNGIDVGRDVVAFRMENALWDSQVKNLLDVRNVHKTDGKLVETVGRDELTAKLTDKLTFKGLALVQEIPKTHDGIDPFLSDPRTGRYYDNNQIRDGKDPSIKTGSMGLNYDFFDWLSINGVWERTNDYYPAYDAFPRGLLSSGNQFITYRHYGMIYREGQTWLYNQEYFPTAPYPTYDIFKGGLRLAPFDNLEMYLNHTRNQYEKAGNIDDNINHTSLELYYLPIKNVNVNLFYQYSRWQDLDKLTQGDLSVKAHHNFTAEILYLISKDQDIGIKFGEESCIDTAHIIRMFYNLRF